MLFSNTFLFVKKNCFLDNMLTQVRLNSYNTYLPSPQGFYHTDLNQFLRKSIIIQNCIIDDEIPIELKTYIFLTKTFFNTKH